MKKTLDSDEKVKLTMDKKLNELKSKLDAIKGTLVGKEEVEDYDKTGGVNIKSRESNSEYSREVVENSEKMEYLSNATALSKKHQIKLYLKEYDSCWGRFKQIYVIAKYFITPFKGYIKNISMRYDEDVITLFKITRRLFIISLLVLLIFAYFFFFYISELKTIYSENQNEPMLCKLGLVCAALYSRIPVSVIDSYTYTLLILTGLIAYQGMTFWFNFSRKVNNSEMYRRDHKKLSMFFFNFWDWSVNSNSKYIQKRNNVKELLGRTIKEYELRENLKTTNFSDYFITWLIRFFVFVFEAGLLIGYSACIAGFYVLKNKMKDSFTGSTPVTSFSIIFVIVSNSFLFKYRIYRLNLYLQ
jgi:hypothetical protein